MKKIILLIFAATILTTPPLNLSAQGIYGTPEKSEKFPLPRLLFADSFSKSKDGLIDSVTIDHKKIALAPPCGAIFGAAYYSSANKLIVVENDGIVRMYHSENKFFKIYGMQSLNYKARLQCVHFTRIPELLYFLAIDVKHEESLGKMSLIRTQEYPDRFERIDLSGFSTYEGIPVDTNTSKEKIVILGAYYYYDHATNSIYLNMGLKKKICLKFTGEIGRPFRTGPYDPLAQAIFIFPEKGVVTKLATGWAIHDMDGNLIKEFIDPAKERWNWWTHPMLQDNNFFVVKRTGPGGIKYKLDIQSGKMIFDENNQ